MNKRRHTIQAQLMGLTLAFSLTIALVVWCSSMYALYNNARQAKLQAAEYGLQLAASNIAQNVQEIDSLVDWCSVDTTVRTYVFNRATNSSLRTAIYSAVSSKYNSLHTQRYVQRFLIYNGTPQYLQFGTNSTMSQVLDKSNIGALPGMEPPGTDLSWDRLCTDPLMAMGSAYGIPITRVMRHTSGKTAQIYLSVSGALFTDTLRSYTLPAGSRLYLIMGGQYYSLRDGTLQQVEALPLDLGDAAGAQTLDERTLVFPNVGVEKETAVLYPIGSHEMYLVQCLPAMSLLQLHGMQTPAFAAVVAVAALGVALALLLRRVVSGPIVRLQRQLSLIAEGHFTTDPSLEWNNELGDIGRGINSLSRSVTALMDKRIEDEKQKQDLEYRMLQNQINPHFLYNTLNSIKWMATIQHAPGIAEMVTALSRLMKSVAKSNERLVPLYEEFALLNDYFTIQQYRYGGTITLDVRYIEDERLCRDCRIPRFTLQPLVENAIFHGIEPKGCAGDISLTVATDPATGDVLIHLKDDGVGMTQSQVDKALLPPGPEDAAAKFRHVGLWNVHRRLQYSFGDAYGLAIESAPGEGTTVSIRLPCRADTETQEGEKTL